MGMLSSLQLEEEDDSKQWDGDTQHTVWIRAIERCTLMPWHVYMYICACICVSLLCRKAVAFLTIGKIVIFGVLQNPKCIPIYSHINTCIQASILAFTFVPGVRKTCVLSVSLSLEKKLIASTRA